MAKSPRSVKVEIDWDRQELKDALTNAHDVGHQEGYEKGLQEILDWLEAAYITDSGRPDRGTDRAKAILEIARSAGRHIRSLKSGKGGKKSS
jgi:hypothetical protein